MSRPPWLTGPRLAPYEREQLREAAQQRRAEAGTLDARSVRALQGAYGVSRRTVYRLAARVDDEEVSDG